MTDYVRRSRLVKLALQQLYVARDLFPLPVAAPGDAVKVQAFPRYGHALQPVALPQSLRHVAAHGERVRRGAKSIVDAGHLDGVDYALTAHILPAGKAAGLVDIGVLKDGAQGGLATAKLDVTFTAVTASLLA